MFCLVFSAWVLFGWLGVLLLRGGARCPAEPSKTRDLRLAPEAEPTPGRPCKALGGSWQAAGRRTQTRPLGLRPLEGPLKRYEMRDASLRPKVWGTLL